jgi:hypothetical protein
MNTPLRNILTWRGVVSGLRDAMTTQMPPSVNDDSMNLMNQIEHYHTAYGYLIESYILNTALIGLAFATMMRRDQDKKIRPWKQFSRTELAVKTVVVFLLFFLAKNVDSVF